MESLQWLKDLFTTNDSVAHIALLYAVVIAVGVYLGKIKFWGWPYRVYCPTPHPYVCSGLRTHSFCIHDRYAGGSRFL